MSLDLFALQVSEATLHPVFKLVLEPRYEPERRELQRWAQGFADRDAKFVRELQTTFESSFWELYLNAALAEWGLPVDLSHHAPDFVVNGPQQFVMEATVANPAKNGKPAYGYGVEDIPSDFTDFNLQSTIRLCNSFSSKVKRYREYYGAMQHVVDKPYVIAMASFDRPAAHLASSRPILAALYGLYYDEQATGSDAKVVVSYDVHAAAKNEQTDVELGLFCDDQYTDVSAVIYSPVATWGKLRALADSPNALTLYTTFHPRPGSLRPEMRHALKRDYSEHLLDGLMVFHNPFARHPLRLETLAHPRIAQMTVTAAGRLDSLEPDDFLLMRLLQSVIER